MGTGGAGGTLIGTPNKVALRARSDSEKRETRKPPLPEEPVSAEKSGGADADAWPAPGSVGVPKAAGAALGEARGATLAGAGTMLAFAAGSSLASAAALSRVPFRTRRKGPSGGGSLEVAGGIEPGSRG